MNYNKGFTLIEILIVIAIITILVSIAIPICLYYMEKVRVNACLYETKTYANYVYYTIRIENSEQIYYQPLLSTCDKITDASNWDNITNNYIIEAKSRGSNIINIHCNLREGANCSVIP